MFLLHVHYHLLVSRRRLFYVGFASVVCCSYMYEWEARRQAVVIAFLCFFASGQSVRHVLHHRQMMVLRLRPYSACICDTIKKSNRCECVVQWWHDIGIFTLQLRCVCADCENKCSEAFLYFFCSACIARHLLLMIETVCATYQRQNVNNLYVT